MAYIILCVGAIIMHVKLMCTCVHAIRGTIVTTLIRVCVFVGVCGYVFVLFYCRFVVFFCGFVCVCLFVCVNL